MTRSVEEMKAVAQRAVALAKLRFEQEVDKAKAEFQLKLEAKRRKEKADRLAEAERRKRRNAYLKLSKDTADRVGALDPDFENMIDKHLSNIGVTRADPAVACQLHLLDLKRAGHTAGPTELKIVSDGVCRPVMIPYAHERSLTGSTSGAMVDRHGDREYKKPLKRPYLAKPA